MKILYGINGTGQGHIVKSINVIYELKRLGHDIDILISGTNHHVKIPYEVKYQFHGVSFEYSEKGSIDWIKTAINLKPIKLLKDTNLDVDAYDKVITDFEPISAWACIRSKKDCIGISHQYSFLSKRIPRPKKKDFIGEFVINKLAPVTTPIGLHFEKYDDFIDYPIIRGDVKILTTSDKGYYTVYLPSYSLKNILNELINYPYQFQVFTKETDKIYIYKNIKICPSSIAGFTNSLINCHGVITSGGFETPSEALFLKKRLMVMPIKGQYEQLCNVEALKQMGVFVGQDITDIKHFFQWPNSISYQWKDPLPKIIQMILE
jgi:uncharacterized protein (TIGR00661 family)